LRANAVFCHWLGYATADLVGKRRLQDLLAMGAKIFHQTHWAPLLRMQGSVSEVKLELIARDGAVIPMVLNAIRRESDGVIVHDVAAFVARDRDRYEQELLYSRKRLEELHGVARDRAVYAEQMIGIVSHDLRNPLGAIRLATELLATAGPKVLDRAVPRITRAVDRANRLIGDLLDFTQARLGTGIAVAIAPVDVHRAVAEIVDDLRGTYPARQLVHDGSGAGTFELDENRLGQLIGNLVANAVAYGLPDSPITISSSVTDAECRVSVHNRGAPIPPEVAKIIFEPMTRGTTAGSKARSVGLGLFIVREIARAHGGSASVASSQEHGTTFAITLPVRT
jgi:sigma-B regulation protein RsbU (phosphoserine phosphatase)